jgi:hypothetical protein
MRSAETAGRRDETTAERRLDRAMMEPPSGLTKALATVKEPRTSSSERANMISEPTGRRNENL